MMTADSHFHSLERYVSSGRLAFRTVADSRPLGGQVHRPRKLIYLPGLTARNSLITHHTLDHKGLAGNVHIRKEDIKRVKA